MDVMTLITNLIQMIVLGFGVYKAVRHMKGKGGSIVLIFFVYAIICYFLCDLYTIATEAIMPNTRIPFGVDAVAEMGECLLMASLLNAIFRENEERLFLETVFSIIYSLAMTALWIAWSGEWTKDILGGFYFGYFIYTVVISLKKSHALSRKLRILLGVLAFAIIAAHSLVFFVPEDYEELVNNLAYVLMFIGIVWLITVAIVYLVKAIRGDSRDEAKKAVAIGFFALIWTMNTLYMSDGVMYYVADFTCSLSLLIIVYDVITLEEKKPKVLVERRARRS